MATPTWGVFVAAIAILVSGCSGGGAKPAPTVTQTADGKARQDRESATTTEPGSSGATEAAEPPSATSTPASSSGAAATATAPASPVHVTWEHHTHRHEKGRYGYEDLVIPTLTNASAKVTSTFNALVSAKAADVRQKLLSWTTDHKPDKDSRFNMRRISSTVYKQRYVSVAGSITGDPTAGSDGFMSSYSVNLDLRTGKTVKLSHFLTADRSRVNALLRKALKKQDVGFGYPDPAKDGYMDWTLGTKGITFIWQQASEGGWDYKVTLPWSQVRR